MELDALPALTATAGWRVKARRFPRGCSKTTDYILDDFPTAVPAAGWLAITAEPDGKGENKRQRGFLQCGFLCVRA